jgi:hypothetical protein
LPAAIWLLNHLMIGVLITVGTTHAKGDTPPVLTTSSAVTIAV